MTGYNREERFATRAVQEACHPREMDQGERHGRSHWPRQDDARGHDARGHEQAVHLEPVSFIREELIYPDCSDDLARS